MAERERLADLAEERRDVEDARFDAAADALRAEADAATTVRARRDAELRLLELVEAHERQRRQELIAAGGPGAAVARAEEAAAPGRAEADRAAIDRQNRTPLGEWLAGVPQSLEQVNEALEQVAANGLRSIEEGLMAVITGAKSLKSAFKDMALSIIADLMQIAIRKAILAGIEAIAGKGAIEMAGGGSFKVQGIPGVDRNLVSLALTRGETVNVIPAGRSRGMGPVEVVPSPYFDVVVDGRVIRTGTPMVATGMVSARAGAQSDLARRQRQAIP